MTDILTSRHWTPREADPETGLPVLPEGQFWRVAPAPAYSPYMSVEIRRKTRLGSRLVASQPMRQAHANRAELLDTALYLMQREDEKVRQNDLADALVGDYPPKTVGGEQ